MTQKPWHKEPLLSAIAFLWVFFLFMFVAVALLVGNAGFDPRAAALWALAPAIVLGCVSALNDASRRFVSKLFIIGLPPS